MRKTAIKTVSAVMALAMTTVAFAGCSKKTKELDEVVENYIDDSGVEVDEITGEKSFKKIEKKINKMDIEDLEDGLAYVADGEAVGEILDDMDYRYSSILDPDDIEIVRAFIMTEDLSDDNPFEGSAGAILSIKFADDESASDTFDWIETALKLSEDVTDIDISDLSSDEYDYDAKKGTGHLIVHSTVATFYEVAADYLDEDIEELEDALDEEFDMTIDDLPEFEVAIFLKGDTIAIVAAYGDAYIDGFDDMLSDAGCIKPSSVESSEEVMEALVRAVYW